MGIPFSVIVSARDIYDHPVTTFAGTVRITDSTDTLIPAVSGDFDQGFWLGIVSIGKAIENVTITVAGDGKKGVSNDFRVIVPEPGDINLDGSVDLADALMVLKALACISVPQIAFSDGKVGIEEVIYILQKVA